MGDRRSDTRWALIVRRNGKSDPVLIQKIFRCKLLTGGFRPEKDLKDGIFAAIPARPFSDAMVQWKLQRREFGPVLSILPLTPKKVMKGPIYFTDWRKAYLHDIKRGIASSSIQQEPAGLIILI